MKYTHVLAMMVLSAQAAPVINKVDAPNTIFPKLDTAPEGLNIDAPNTIFPKLDSVQPKPRLDSVQPKPRLDGFFNVDEGRAYELASIAARSPVAGPPDFSGNLKLTEGPEIVARSPVAGPPNTPEPYPKSWGKPPLDAQNSS